jgi:hypothetical protein
MSKRRIRGTFFALFFFFAVAVFPHVKQARTSTNATHKTTSGRFQGTSLLTADGTDPWPVPPPIPWPSAVA